ncbi:MAG: hypothetical protein OWV35_04840 [Firmicutes bacterium]|nr:hypothetical protein [Bacillota bacterium]
MRGTRLWWGAMVVLGLALGTIRAVEGPLHGSAIGSGLADLLAAVVVILAARAVRRQGGHPAWTGAGLGVVFAALGSWPVWLVHVTRTQVRTLLASRLHVTPSAAEITQTLRLMNAPAAHAVSYGGALLGGLVIGLILGAIGGATTRPGEPSQAV